MEDLPSNVEPFAPKVLARWMIQRHGDWDIEAAMTADRFFESNQNYIAKVGSKLPISLYPYDWSKRLKAEALMITNRMDHDAESV
jgi:hypothetical protein